MPFAKLEGREIHYTDYAPDDSSSSEKASGLTIIFVHGLGSTQNYYGPILQSLSRYRRVTFDNYGAGRSRFFADLYPETSIKQIAKDVVGLMDLLKVEKAVVVGYSMGGMVPTTIAAAESSRDRIVAGVCIGPVHPGESVAEVFKKRIGVVSEGGMETMANTIPSAATGPATTMLQKSFIREMLLGQDPQGYIANCKAIMNATPPDYAAVQCPILIIAGEVDKSAPLDGCKYIFEHLGTEDKKLEVLNGIGHWLCVEDGETVGLLVKQWCGKFEQS